MHCFGCASSKIYIKFGYLKLFVYKMRFNLCTVVIFITIRATPEIHFKLKFKKLG